MKKHLLVSILCCGMVLLAAAAPAGTTASTYKSFIGEREKKKNAISLAARKRSNSKKLLAKKSTKKTSALRLSKSLRNKHSRKTKLRISKSELVSIKAEKARNLSNEDIQMGNSFVGNRGRMPWPVDGTISLGYGVYTIEGTRLKGDCPGIIFSTPDNSEPVIAVADGVVADVNTKGEISTVCVRHGKYTTVYGNLSIINVSKGDIVKMNQPIGRIGNGYDKDGSGELTFIVMEDNDNINPAPWLNK